MSSLDSTVACQSLTFRRSRVLTGIINYIRVLGEMVEVSHRQTPRKDCDAKAPRQYSTISGLRLSVALPNDRAAASQGCEAVVSVCSLEEKLWSP